MASGYDKRALPRVKSMERPVMVIEAAQRALDTIALSPRLAARIGDDVTRMRRELDEQSDMATTGNRIADGEDVRSATASASAARRRAG